MRLRNLREAVPSRTELAEVESAAGGDASGDLASYRRTLQKLSSRKQAPAYRIRLDVLSVGFFTKTFTLGLVLLKHVGFSE